MSISTGSRTHYSPDPAMRTAGPGLLVAAGVLLVLLVAAVGTPADADLWGHLRFGQDIVTDGAVVQADRYSFTSDRPWINHEWLSEVVFAGAYRLGGPAGLVALKVAVIGLLCGLLWWRLRRIPAAPGVALAIVVLGFVGTFWRVHNVRPQLFSALLFAVLLTMLVEADAGRRRGLLIVPLVFALWVNLHGGWIVGLGVLGFWTAVRVCDWRDWRDPAKRSRPIAAATVGVAAVFATLLNPYGVRLWMFLGETVRFGRADIEEWGSILTYPALLGIPWGLVAIAAGIAILRTRVSRRVDYLMLVAGLAVASFRVSRLDAFFAIAVIILLGPELTRTLQEVWPRTVRATRGPGRGVVAITVVAIVAMMIPAATILAPYASCLAIRGLWVPEADAGRFIIENHLTGRMLTWFDWGEYAIWHFGPALRVSLDGRRETVYTDAMIQAHRRFYAADDTAEAFLSQLDPDYLWLPLRLPVADRLAAWGWTPIFKGPTSVVFARHGAGPFHGVSELPPAVRCFPGP